MSWKKNWLSKFASWRLRVFGLYRDADRLMARRRGRFLRRSDGHWCGTRGGKQIRGACAQHPAHSRTARLERFPLSNTLFSSFFRLLFPSLLWNKTAKWKWIVKLNVQMMGGITIVLRQSDEQLFCLGFIINDEIILSKHFFKKKRSQFPLADGTCITSQSL